MEKIELKLEVNKELFDHVSNWLKKDSEALEVLKQGFKEDKTQCLVAIVSGVLDAIKD